MSVEASRLLDAFEALSLEEKRVFAREVLNRVLPENSDVSGDNEDAAYPRNLRVESERAKAFREWASRHSIDAPPLSDEAISRETIYSTRS